MEEVLQYHINSPWNGVSLTAVQMLRDIKTNDPFTMVQGKTFIQSVLIVDDEPMARTLLRLMLVRSGYEVIEAEDGFDALDKIRTNPPDLVILDVMMPGMDGLKVCASIRGDLKLPNLPVIMLSAKSDIIGIHDGLDVGANKYLTKPVSPEELSRHVREVLDTTQRSTLT